MAMINIQMNYFVLNIISTHNISFFIFFLSLVLPLFFVSCYVQTIGDWNMEGSPKTQKGNSRFSFKKSHSLSNFHKGGEQTRKPLLSFEQKDFETADTDNVFQNDATMLPLASTGYPQRVSFGGDAYSQITEAVFACASNTKGFLRNRS